MRNALRSKAKNILGSYIACINVFLFFGGEGVGGGIGQRFDIFKF